MADDQSPNIWTKLGAIITFLTALTGLAAALAQCSDHPSEPKPDPSKPAVEKSSPRAPSSPTVAARDITGEWEDAMHKWDILQHSGGTFTFSFEGRCYSTQFNVQGDGTIAGDTLNARYGSAAGPSGGCYGTISDKTIIVNCSDTMCGKLNLTLIRR
jgi:hypothetical protein